MHRALLSAVLSLSVLLSPLVAAQDVSYTFTTIDVPGAVETSASGINNRGQIVGRAGDTFVGIPGYSFLKDDTGFTTIDVPGATSTSARGINNVGEIVGSFTDATGTHGFVATPVDKTSHNLGGASTTVTVPRE